MIEKHFQLSRSPLRPHVFHGYLLRRPLRTMRFSYSWDLFWVGFSRRLSTGGAQKTRVPTFSWSRKILSRFTGEPFFHLKIDIECTPLGTRSIKQPTPSEEGAALVRWTTLLDTGSPLLADYPWCLFFNDDNMWLCSHRLYCKLSTCPGLVYTSGLSLGPLHRAAPILWSVFFCQKTTSNASLGRRGHIILPADGTRLSQVEI